MKKLLVNKLAGAFVLIASFAASTDAWARPPRPREWCGVLEQFDPGARELTVRSSSGGKSLEAVWTKGSRFVRTRNPASVAAQTKEARVCAHYRSPLFGRPFVTKVVWSDG